MKTTDSAFEKWLDRIFATTRFRIGVIIVVVTLSLVADGGIQLNCEQEKLYNTYKHQIMTSVDKMLFWRN